MGGRVVERDNDDHGQAGSSPTADSPKKRTFEVPRTLRYDQSPVGGLNAAIGASSGDVVVRVDGHAELSPGYIRCAVETLQRTGADNVGGIQRAVGTTPMQRAIAAAMSSPFGVGDAKFHYGGEPGPVDTVYLGVFRRKALALRLPAVFAMMHHAWGVGFLRGADETHDPKTGPPAQEASR